MSVCEEPPQQRGRLLLHMPKLREPPIGKDDPALRRAGRIALAANAVGDLDVKAVAETYREETGASGIEAVAAAAIALDAALKHRGDPAAGTAAAAREIRELSKKQQRGARLEAFKSERAAEEGPLGEVKRDAVREDLEARASRAVDHKAIRMTEEAAARRAEREERATAAASRRVLSDAKSWLRLGQPRRGRHRRFDDEELEDYDRDVPSTVDDPSLKNARALCRGVSLVVAELDQQNERLLLKRNSLPRTNTWSVTRSTSVPARPGPNAGSHAVRFDAFHAAAASADEQALVAKAQELLADFKPSESERRRERNTTPRKPLPQAGAEVAKSAQATKPAEAARTMQATKSAETVKTMQATKSTESAKAAEVAKMAEAAKAAPRVPSPHGDAVMVEQRRKPRRR